MIKTFIFVVFTIYALFFNTVNEIKKVNQQSYLIEVLMIDSEFTDQEVMMIQNAAMEWQRTTNETIKFYISYNPDEEIKFTTKNDNTFFNAVYMMPVSSTSSFAEGFKNATGSSMVGYYDNKNFSLPTILIVRDSICSELDYKTIVMHELGHSMLLEHNYQVNSLMFPTTTGSGDCITEYDLKQLCKIYSCDASKLHPCDTKTFSLILGL